MGKYTNLEKDVFSVFDGNAWKLELIKTFPSNFIPVNHSNEYIRVSIIPSGSGINLKSISGILIIDIFTPAGGGPHRASVIADKLDDYLQGKHLSNTSGAVTQFQSSSMVPKEAEKTLQRSSYTIPFNYFGV